MRIPAAEATLTSDPPPRAAIFGAAARAGVQTVLLPRRNEKDLAEIPPEVLEKLDVKLVETLDQVLVAALEPA